MNISALKKACLFSVFTLSSALSIADTWTPDWLTVTSVTTYGTQDRILLQTAEGQQYAEGCVANSWEVVSNTEERRARVYSTLLTALTTGMKIKMWYSTEECGSWNYHKGHTFKLSKN